MLRVNNEGTFGTFERSILKRHRWPANKIIYIWMSRQGIPVVLSVFFLNKDE